MNDQVDPFLKGHKNDWSSGKHDQLPSAAINDVTPPLRPPLAITALCFLFISKCHFQKQQKQFRDDIFWT
jgi:hypothetical protein